MNEGSSSSASRSTGTTPASAAPNTKPENAEKQSEAEFLQQQARDAQQALSRTIGLIGKDLGHTVDPRAWTRSHPWLSLTGAAIGGFTVMMLIPSEEQRALRRLQRIQRAMAPKLRIDKDDLTAAAPGKPGLASKLLHEIFATARPIIMSAISAAMVSAKQQPSDGAQGVEDAAARNTTNAATGSDPTASGMT